MGVRANALTDHRVADFRDQAAVMSLLAHSLPATLAVEEYWRATQENYTYGTDAWSVRFRDGPPEVEYLRYDGPGGFMVSFGDRVARVHASCRWSGFCTMAALQRVHVEALRSISRALGGTRAVLIPDDDLVEEIALYDGGSLEDSIAYLEKNWGPPQPATAIVTDDVEVYYQLKLAPWFVEKL